MAFDDLTGRQFDRWTVLRYSHTYNRRIYWLCVCSCDEHTEKAVWASDLRRGTSRSCGCLMRELSAERRTTHGMACHPAHANWRMARSRCRNPNDDGYYLYGARGIKFSSDWDDFAAFWRDMGATWFEGASLDRIDTNGNYESSNCRWATAKQQANNRRDNRMIPTPGGPMNVTQAAEAFKISRDTIAARIRYGWSETDLLLPVRPNRVR